MPVQRSILASHTSPPKSKSLLTAIVKYATVEKQAKGVFMKKVLLSMAVAALATVGALPAASASAAPYCGITWGSGAKVSGPASTSKYLTNIRAGQHDCYDRLVLDLNGATAGYDVRYVTNVGAEGTGDIIPLTGGAKLRITLKALAYNNQGQPTYGGITGQPLPGIDLKGYQTFRQAKFAGSFEQTSVGLGVRALLPFRVLQSENHVIIDVAHKW